jgi:hypothetical protein
LPLPRLDLGDKDLTRTDSAIPGDARPVRLHEVIDALGDEFADTVKVTDGRARRRGEPAADGRNCYTFDVTRWWAYDNNECGLAAITAKAEEVNDGFAVPMSTAEVRGIARSISKYMRNGRRRAARQRRRRDFVEGLGLSLAERQAIAGKRSGEARKAATEAKIAAGTERLRAEGKTEPTQRQLATASGLSIRTIKRRWTALRQQGANRCPLQDSGTTGAVVPASGCRPNPPSSAVSGKKRRDFGFSFLSKQSKIPFPSFALEPAGAFGRRIRGGVCPRCAGGARRASGGCGCCAPCGIAWPVAPAQ